MKNGSPMWVYGAVNYTLMLFLWIAVLVLLWYNDSFHLAVKICLVPVTFFACGHIGHRWIPKLAGPIIDAILQKHPVTPKQDK